MKERVLLFDADWLMHMTAHAENSRAIKAGKPLAPPAAVCKRIDTYINKCMNDIGGTDYILVLSGNDNYRKHIEYSRKIKDGSIETGKLYKANRKGTELPPYLTDLYDYMVDKHNAVVIEKGEADDGLGIWQTLYPDTSVIVTVDKDLDMIPGEHYNPVKGTHYRVSPERALRTYCAQLIKGDSIDNIPGLYNLTGYRNSTQLKEVLDGVIEEYSNMMIKKGYILNDILSRGQVQHIGQGLVAQAVREHFGISMGSEECEELRDTLNTIASLVYICREEEQLEELHAKYTQD